MMETNAEKRGMLWDQFGTSVDKMGKDGGISSMISWVLSWGFRGDYMRNLGISWKTS